MEYKQSQNNCGERRSWSGPVGSFSEIVDEVRGQLEIDCFPESDRAQAEEICLIIAEVMMLPDNMQMQIGGDKLSVGLVRGIYRRLTHEHIDLVIRNYAGVGYMIRHKKTYLRTALYNCVFEYESHFINLYSSYAEGCKQ
ncbi:MAG: hypothetical protein ACI3XR_10025 [Eubacteriales bacterium]